MGIFTETNQCSAGYPNAEGHMPQESPEDSDAESQNEEVQTSDPHDECHVTGVTHCTSDTQEKWR
jgi:hypothetical protein